MYVSMCAKIYDRR